MKIFFHYLICSLFFLHLSKKFISLLAPTIWYSLWFKFLNCLHTNWSYTHTYWSSLSTWSYTETSTILFFHLFLTFLQNMDKNDRTKVVPRVCIIGGKAAPGYEIAKKIIKLCHSVAEKINNDTDIGDLLKLVIF